MPSVFQFMENPQIFPYESTLSDNPDILHALIDYISVNPNPLLLNEQQCYVYPSKAAEILSMATTYRVLIIKRERKNSKTDEDQSYYPHLDRLFKNIKADPNLEQSLLGYLNKVLVSLAKKTPEIYQYFKDNQAILTNLIKDNRILRNFQQFWITFLVQSTMSLYIFLKNILIRGLMFRIIDQKDTDNLAVYQILTGIYEQFARKLYSKFLPEDEREELEQIAHSFQDQDFVTLLVLKLSALRPQKTLWIGKLLLILIKNASNKQQMALSISKNHIQAFQDYFQGYQESSGFMDYLLQDQLQILKVLLTLSEYKVLEIEHQSNLLKRLLVYSSIHRKNSLLHGLLLKMITNLAENNRIQPFKEINVIPFIMKNSQLKVGKHAYGSLIWQICQIWKNHQSQFEEFTEEEQKQFIKQQLEKRSEKLTGLSLYKAVPLQSPPKESFQVSTEQISKFYIGENAEKPTEQTEENAEKPTEQTEEKSKQQEKKEIK